MKKRILLALCLVLMLSVISPASFIYADDFETPADDPVDPEPFVKINIINTSLSINSSGKSSDYSLVYVPDGTCTVHLRMDLQRETSTDQWQTIKYWTKTGTQIVSLDKEWYVVHGYTYRLLISVDVYDSDGLVADSTAVVSNYVTY